MLSSSTMKHLRVNKSTLMPYDTTNTESSPVTAALKDPFQAVIFPLSGDHLITLLQFNVLRGSIANRQLLSPLSPHSCSTETLHVLPSHTSSLNLVPPSLAPTHLQCTVPHEDWMDIIPDPKWRDNVIRAAGTFDEDELWSDLLGGLFEGFPDSEIEHRGVVAWSPPWEASGWEVSPGFWEKWGWTLVGCVEVVDATNRWRAKRGQGPLGKRMAL